VIQKHYNGSQVTTFFNRTIPADEYHALNYIIQSTAADLFHTQLIKLWKLLKANNRNSDIAFCIHDSLILDFSEKDMKNLVEFKNEFADTCFGKFLVNVSVGKNFGEMKKINI
jgi:DNA polymerase I-like protein with 3'-5' exonuclease and polymerase domains